MVHRPERLADIIATLREYRIEPKVIKFVYPKINKKPNLVLIKSTKYGNSFLDIKEPIIVYDGNGEYTDEIKKIYGRW